MELQVLYWHWLIFGAILVISEIFIPNFTAFWFGLGCIIVAVALWALPTMAVSGQLLLWAVASCLFTVAWFKYVKPRMADRTTAGISREAVIGEAGQVIRTPAGKNRGQVRFTTPLLGADEWSFICEEPVELGERVFVKEISGNTLIVKK
jgi:membrane protein implicated in regulation of membrane protease activity